ncbi:hypothetical protein [Halosolutus halophilus]|uniref:hypothetical protein n=1 Tax=Halosolutus halophilus TaxID=1552990 RepID=UPI002234F0DC|nr:hypothetical protein [Halosolutus halophilus]
MKEPEWSLLAIAFLLSVIAYELALILDGIQALSSPSEGVSSLSEPVLVLILIFLYGIPVYVGVIGVYLFGTYIVDSK